MEFSTKHLAITVHKIQFEEDEDVIEDISCCLFLNTRLVEVVNLSFQENLVLVPFISPKQHMQLIFKRKSELEIFGCISIIFESFEHLELGIYSQWMTLFDDPEDDIFDGIIGEDDLECPRAYVTFQIFEDSAITCPTGADEEMMSERDVRDLETSQLNVIPACCEKILSTKRNLVPLLPSEVNETKSNELPDQQEEEAAEAKEEPNAIMAISTAEYIAEEETEPKVMEHTKPSLEEIEELRKLIVEKDNRLLEIQERLQRQTECYEEQFKTMNDEAVELKFKVTEQESLIEVLREQLANVNEIQTRQLESHEIYSQIQLDLSKYQITVESLEANIQDLQSLYEQTLERERDLQGQHGRMLNQLKELEQQHQMMTTLNEKLIVENQGLKSSTQSLGEERFDFEALKQEMEAERQWLEEHKQQFTAEKQQFVSDKQQLVSEKLQLVSDKLHLMKDRRNIEKEGKRIVELEDALEFHRGQLISDNIENVVLKAELYLANQQTNQYRLDVSKTNQQFEEFKGLIKELEDGKLVLQKTIEELREENCSLKNEIKEIGLQFETAKAKEIENRLQDYNAVIGELQLETSKLKEEGAKTGSESWEQKFAFLNRKPLIKKEIVVSGKIEEGPKNSQKELQNKLALIQELHYSNNELKAQNILLKEKANLNESLLHQLNDFRKIIQANERERQLLQEEILKVNSSYINLTQKYMGHTHYSTTPVSIKKSVLTSNADQDIRPTEQSSSSETQLDDIDRKLLQIMGLVGLPLDKFVKISEGVYSFDNLMYSLFLNKGTLYVNDNGKPISFLEFVKFIRYKIGPQKLDRAEDRGKENDFNSAVSKNPKSRSRSKRARLSLENVTVETEKNDDWGHLMNFEEASVDPPPNKAASKTPVGGRRGGAIPKSSEKRSSTQKTPTNPTNSSYFLLKPKSFKAMGPVLLNAKPHQNNKQDSHC